MNYGFVIDNGSCIGCHACSTACKSENQVPVGVARTWVKTVEVGHFPDVRRSFQVSRCNHCANPPCVRSCPTSAMYRRPDGIVEFDGDACIGCKACLQACPYDAIYLDPETHTAAKCHYCSHRIDVGLEPACVVVCPEHAIIAGDLDDPLSEISRILAANPVTVRKPEQGTAPKVFYVDGHAAAQVPTSAAAGALFAASNVHTEQLRQHELRVSEGGQGRPAGWPLAVGGRMAEHMVQVTWNQQHQIPWHWPIAAYLPTKHIAGATFALLGASALMGQLDPVAMRWGGGFALLNLAITLGLLVYDLDRPDRMIFLFTRPQWRSWVARAAWLLSAFAAVSVLWWTAELAGFAGLRIPFAVAAVPLGLGSAVYSAFLFAQAEGRDLWQSPHLPFAFTAQALALGLGTLAAFGSVGAATSAFPLALALSLAVMLVGDLATPQATEVARRGAWEMTRGRWKGWYGVGAVGLGHLAPLALLAGGAPPLIPLVLAALGNFAWARAFTASAQEIPNS